MTHYNNLRDLAEAAHSAQHSTLIEPFPKIETQAIQRFKNAAQSGNLCIFGSSSMSYLDWWGLLYDLLSIWVPVEFLARPIGLGGHDARNGV